MCLRNSFDLYVNPYIIIYLLFIYLQQRNKSLIGIQFQFDNMSITRLLPAQPK